MTRRPIDSPLHAQRVGSICTGRLRLGSSVIILGRSTAMRFAALTALASTAGCATLRGGEPTRSADPATICQLVQGDVTGWRGLSLAHDRLPDCLGPVVRKGARRFGHGATLMADTHRIAGGEVDVYWWANGGQVDLIDVRPRTTPEAEPLLAALSAAAIVHRYTEDDLAAWDLEPPAGGWIEERIDGSRGRSLLVARDEAGAAHVLRWRGFAPMAASRYVEDYVEHRIEPIE
jgi:hypothetical protein